ncbi:YciI family protein [Denitrobaculum tricleocarpae]|uniref:YCII-related domain-containing protein n=1 Tax=Denitrobaculum tricleocarpae TaxID=2591009 RepID=A0A545TTK2_9PROT|nr:YciI family protein [Denitrobaculum tricleocarpae]TQV80481.1 hypothetical protein FKG95_09900 [Denitrobaculum tricleocarpae]
MIYAVFFEDNESQADKRREYMTAHLAFLERNANRITAAGPLADTADGRPAGGLWLVTAEDAGAVQDLVEEDPFWPTGLRRSHRILHWTRVFADGARKI